MHLAPGKPSHPVTVWDFILTAEYAQLGPLERDRAMISLASLVTDSIADIMTEWTFSSGIYLEEVVTRNLISRVYSVPLPLFFLFADHSEVSSLILPDMKFLP